MLNDNLWEIQFREEVMAVLDDGYPTVEQVELFGPGGGAGEDGCNGCFIDGVTAAGTTMDMGMFGYNGYYYFYMKFIPSTTYRTAESTFGVWFQIGGEDSEWQGVQKLENTSVEIGDKLDLSPVSASN